jgi:hypothetical protein
LYCYHLVYKIYILSILERIPRLKVRVSKSQYFDANAMGAKSIARRRQKVLNFELIEVLTQ